MESQLLGGSGGVLPHNLAECAIENAEWDGLGLDRLILILQSSQS